MIANHTKLLILAIAALAVLAAPVVNVHARGPPSPYDPTVTAVHTGGTGGGDGDVIFTVRFQTENPAVGFEHVPDFGSHAPAT